MLDLVELKSLAPAAFATSPAAHCSPRYVMIPTLEVIEALKTEGYVPVEAKQDRSRSEERDPLHARHLIRFRLAGGSVKKLKKVGDVTPDLVVINSSDGHAPFSMDLGLYRLVCSNGMTIRQGSLGNVGTMHQRMIAADVIRRAQDLSRNTKPLFDKIERWGALPITAEQANVFAGKAATIRWGEKAGQYDPASLLEVRRPEDEESTFWNVLNRIQEAGMRGGVTGTAANGTRKLTSRSIVGIDGEIDFNTRLWTAAEEFAATL